MGLEMGFLPNPGHLITFDRGGVGLRSFSMLCIYCNPTCITKFGFLSSAFVEKWGGGP